MTFWASFVNFLLEFLTQKGKGVFKQRLSEDGMTFNFQLRSMKIKTSM